MISRRSLLGCAAAFAAPGGAALAQATEAAEAYPSRPLRLVIPLPPGGGADLLGRLMATSLGKVLGQAVVVDNRAGAGGTIGSRYVAQTRADGYTLLLGYTSSHGINPALLSVPYDAVADFTPVSLLATAPNVLVCNPRFSPNSVAEVVEQARKQPEGVRYASAGIGSAPHLSGVMFDQKAGTRMLHVPYRGNGPALLAVMSGEVEMTFASLPSALSLRQNGQVKVLGVTSPARHALMADVPPVADTLPGFDTGQWYAIYAPPNLPAPLLERLNRATNEALGDPAVAAQIQGEGFQIMGSTSEELRRYTQNEITKWRQLAAETGLRLE
jgi:tripartite-type tricarboxylate transporter receptor subunit TctC